jgi:hypothetical protein
MAIIVEAEGREACVTFAAFLFLLLDFAFLSAERREIEIIPNPETPSLPLSDWKLFPIIFSRSTQLPRKYIKSLIAFPVGRFLSTELPYRYCVDINTFPIEPHATNSIPKILLPPEPEFHLDSS